MLKMLKATASLSTRLQISSDHPCSVLTLVLCHNLHLSFQLYQSDPFSLYHSIMRTMLNSWTQLINFLEIDIESSRRATPETFSEELEHLRGTSSLLYEGAILSWRICPSSRQMAVKSGLNATPKSKWSESQASKRNWSWPLPRWMSDTLISSLNTSQ